MEIITLVTSFSTYKRISILHLDTNILLERVLIFCTCQQGKMTNMKSYCWIDIIRRLVSHFIN